MPMSSTGSDSFRPARRLAVCSRTLGVALLLTATAWPAFAQGTPPATGDQGTNPPKTEEEKAKAAKPPEEKIPAVTEEITVTARKREETLQDVPFSVAAPTQDLLRSRAPARPERAPPRVAGSPTHNLAPAQGQA